jgi:hypothetical protein
MTSDKLSEQQISRRKLLKRAGIVGGIAWTAPIIESLVVPAAASGTGVVTTISLSATITSGTVVTQDSSSAALTTCTLGGYASGQAAGTRVVSGTASATNGSNPETANLTIAGLPLAGTCTISAVALCGAAGTCVTATGSKPANSTTGTVNISGDCGGNIAFTKVWIVVSC